MASAVACVALSCAPSPLPTPSPAAPLPPPPASTSRIAAPAPALEAYPALRAEDRTFVVLGDAPRPPAVLRETEYIGGGKLLEADYRELAESERTPITLVASATCVGRAKARVRIAFAPLPPDSAHWSEALEIDGCPLPKGQSGLAVAGEHPEAVGVSHTEQRFADDTRLPIEEKPPRARARRDTSVVTRFVGLDLDLVVRRSQSGDETLEVRKNGVELARHRDVFAVRSAVRVGDRFLVLLASWGWGTVVEVTGDALRVSSGVLEPARPRAAHPAVEPPTLPVFVVEDDDRQLEYAVVASHDAVAARAVRWHADARTAAFVKGEAERLAKPVELTLLGRDSTCNGVIRRQRLVGLAPSARFGNEWGSSTKARWELVLPIEDCALDGASVYLALPRTTASHRWFAAPEVDYERVSRTRMQHRWSVAEAGLDFEAWIIHDVVLARPPQPSLGFLDIRRRGKKLATYPGVVPFAVVQAGGVWYAILSSHSSHSLIELAPSSLIVRAGELEPVSRQ